MSPFRCERSEEATAGSGSVHGVGVDLVLLARFRRFAREHEERLSEMFTRVELARGTDGMADAFAVKEAALKAIGGLTGWELDWREIAWESGRVALRGTVASHAQALGIFRLAGSVSRFGRYTMASVIAERGARGRRPTVGVRGRSPWKP